MRDLLEDGIRVSGPGEWFGVFVVMGEVIPNRGLQFADVTEGPAPNPPVCEQAEEAFNLIQPTRAGWREMQVITWAAGKPALNFGHLVRAVIVHHQMNIEVLRDGFVDPLQEP